MSTKGSLLIVDDSVSLLEACQTWFELENFEVHISVSGEQALEIFRKHRIDILITDYNMPGMNGVELIREVVKSDPDMPVILITEFGNMESAKECIRLGVTDYLEKQKELKCIQKNGAIDLNKLQESIEKSIKEALRLKIVKAMNKSLLLWQRIIDKPIRPSYKSDFAEKSGLWSVQNDDGILRTRGLDRYLSLKTLPMKPKKHLVAASIRFVLDHWPHCDHFEPEHEKEQRNLQVLYESIEASIWY